MRSSSSRCTTATTSAARPAPPGSRRRCCLSPARCSARDAHPGPALVGGGFFYAFYLLVGHRLFFLVGDVSGKGLAASLFMALSKSLLKSIALRGGGEPAEIVCAADAEIGRDNPESLFVTVFAAVLDARTGYVRYCNAGHEPPLLCQPGEAPQRLAESAGPP